ncbi:MAG: TIGR03086 family protein, partial [Mycobacterium sp.]
MSSDLRPGPDSPPTDELASAEAALSALQHVLHPIARDELS